MDQSQFYWSKGTILFLAVNLREAVEEKGPVAKLVQVAPLVGFLVSLHDLIVPLSAYHGPLTSGRGILRHRSGEMLQLQKRLDDAMGAKGEEWCHDLEEPVPGIT